MSAGHDHPLKPRLVYDGDCAFCRYTVEYAASVTSGAVEYRPYQEVLGEHPEVTGTEFASSIQLFVDGERYERADAAFRTLAIGGSGFWQRLYRHLPGFAVLSDALYDWVSRHRGVCLAFARPLFGRRLRRAEFNVTADLLIRGIALCGLFAFLSLWSQLDGLIGPGGILPAADFFNAVAGAYGIERFWFLPTVFWLDASPAALHGVCALGTLATLTALLGRWRCVASVTAYACYLSLLAAGQVFLSYQWDIFLIECFVVAAVLARAPGFGVWLARLALFRFMFLSGFVKLASGDPTWADGSALAFHFETQPLPTALAWYVHHLPPTILEWAVWTTFVIELALPFCIFLPRNARLVAAGGFVLLEVLIFATGNYNFFNVLTIVLCVSLLDDRWTKPIVRGVATRPGRRLCKTLAACIMALGILVTLHTVFRLPAPVAVLTRAAAPLHLANPYGLFAIMTTRRDELIVEGSMDGRTWSPYVFPFKPGDIAAAPRWTAPHQPRLDWQMWFAALTNPEGAPWIYDFAFALLEARPAVLKLVADPFDGARPKSVRIVRHRYRFSTPAEKSSTDQWWVRGDATTWLPQTQLRRPKITHDPLTLD